MGREKGGIQKIIKTELLDSPFLFILLFVVVGFPVNDQLVRVNNQWGMNKTPLIHYFHVNKRRLVNQSSYPNIRNTSSIVNPAFSSASEITFSFAAI
ncbi:hypothetical protein ACT4UT_16705, partial [Bacillus sp. B-TM1]